MFIVTHQIYQMAELHLRFGFCAEHNFHYQFIDIINKCLAICVVSDQQVIYYYYYYCGRNAQNNYLIFGIRHSETTPTNGRRTCVWSLLFAAIYHEFNHERKTQSNRLSIEPTHSTRTRTKYDQGNWLFSALFRRIGCFCSIQPFSTV